MRCRRAAYRRFIGNPDHEAIDRILRAAVDGEAEDVTTSTVFAIMSMTKLVCTTAALQQVERVSSTSMRRSSATAPASLASMCSRASTATRRGRGCPRGRRRFASCCTADALDTPMVADPGSAFVYGASTDWLGCVIEPLPARGWAWTAAA
jgi:methyl acetate hydrolase